MPGVNGLELAQRLRNIQPRLKVLYMTGYADRQIMSNNKLQGGVDLIHKPFTREELREKIRNVLRETSSPSNEEETTQ